MDDPACIDVNDRRWRTHRWRDHDHELGIELCIQCGQCRIQIPTREEQPCR